MIRRSPGSALRPARLLAVLLLAALPLASACASYKARESASEFEFSQRKYTQYIRWSQFDRAREFVAPESNDAFHEQTAGLQNVRFTDYAIRDVDMNEDGDSATVQVTYYAYLRTQLVAIAFDEEQAWEKADGSAWLVRSTHFAQRDLQPGEGSF